MQSTQTMGKQLSRADLVAKVYHLQSEKVAYTKTGDNHE